MTLSSDSGVPPVGVAVLLLMVAVFAPPQEGCDSDAPGGDPAAGTECEGLTEARTVERECAFNYGAGCLPLDGWRFSGCDLCWNDTCVRYHRIDVADRDPLGFDARNCPAREPLAVDDAQCGRAPACLPARPVCGVDSCTLCTSGWECLERTLSDDPLECVPPIPGDSDCAGYVDGLVETALDPACIWSNGCMKLLPWCEDFGCLLCWYDSCVASGARQVPGCIPRPEPGSSCAGSDAGRLESAPPDPRCEGNDKGCVELDPICGELSCTLCYYDRCAHYRGPSWEGDCIEPGSGEGSGDGSGGGLP
jgi:hypothetical protein